MFPRLRASLTHSAVALAFIVWSPCLANAQPASPPALDRNVVARVNRLYPGFEEILEKSDSRALSRLARALSAHPSPDTLTVLIRMLRQCPAWTDDPVIQIDQTARAVKALPIAELSDVLVRGNADQRHSAAHIFTNIGLVSPADRARLVDALLVARKDSNNRVRESVAATLKALGYEELNPPLLVSAPGDPNVTYLITAEKKAGFVDHQLTTTFPPATVALFKRIFPSFLTVLETQEYSAVREMMASIERARDPNATPLLVWMLSYGHRHSENLIINRLVQAQHLGRLPFEDLATWLETDDPAVRGTIVQLLSRLLRPPAPLLPRDRERILAALIGSLKDPDFDVRAHAIQSLRHARSAEAVGPLVASAEEMDLPSQTTMTVQALVAIGNRTALPSLERWAQSSLPTYVREDAAQAFIDIARPADPSSEAKRLFWEQPDTALERQVLAQGTTALPLAWRALSASSAPQRRAAGALLGWFPSTGSIKPILSALTRSPGALTRAQLLFDLNMILLSEGTRVTGDTSDLLARQHMRWLYDQLANAPIDSDIRSAVLAQKTIAVFPDRVTSAFSTSLTASKGQFSATAVRSESPQAFRDWVAANGCGVAFHAISAAEGVARVAATIYLPGGRIANQSWISLYRYEGGKWVLLPVSPHPVLREMLNEPNLLPTIQRNYGPDDPLKILRLDLAMERIRVDLKASEHLRNENRYSRHRSTELDATYVPLLEKYRRSDAPSVRFTAERVAGTLTGQPNLPLWIDALAEQSGTPYQAMAQQVLAGYTVAGFKSKGLELAGAERQALASAAMKPDPVDPRLLPQTLPQSENIYRAQRWDRFGLVDVRSGSGTLGGSGYSMLFERRDDRWVFLCVVLYWIS